MKYTLSFIFLLICTILHSQESIYLKRKGYEGTIFSKDHFVFVSIEKQKDRYTPTMTDIADIEQLLKDSICYIIRNQLHYNPPINKKTLKKYKRQYVGFMTKDNEIVIWINFLKEKNIDKKELMEDIITVYDGGADFWSIFVNLSKKKLFKMEVNGVS